MSSRKLSVIRCKTLYSSQMLTLLKYFPLTCKSFYTSHVDLFDVIKRVATTTKWKQSFHGPISSASSSQKGSICTPLNSSRERREHQLCAPFAKTEQSLRISQPKAVRLWKKKWAQWTMQFNSFFSSLLNLFTRLVEWGWLRWPLQLEPWCGALPSPQTFLGRPGELFS